MYFVFLAVDLTYGAVYCFACSDYVYDTDFEDIARKLHRRASGNKGKNPTCKSSGLFVAFFAF